MNGARNTERVEEVRNRSSRKKLSFMTSRASYSQAVLCSSGSGSLPLPSDDNFAPPTRRRRSSSRRFAAVCRLPTAMTHFDEDTHRHSRLSIDKKETGRTLHLRPNFYVLLEFVFPRHGFRRIVHVFSEFINRRRG